MMGKTLYTASGLDAAWHMMKAEAEHLKDCHVVYLDHLDPETLVDRDCDAYKGAGWYTTDESGVISSGPHTSFIKATFESGRYVGAEVGTSAMATLDLCHLIKADGKVWIQRLDHFHKAAGPWYLLGATDLPADPGTPTTEPIAGTDLGIQGTPPGKPLNRPAGPTDLGSKSFLQIAADKPIKPLDRSPLIRAPLKRIIVKPDPLNRSVGVVVAVGRQVETSGVSDPMMRQLQLYKIGDCVVLTSYAGTTFALNGVTYLSVKPKDIIVITDAGVEVGFGVGVGQEPLRGQIPGPPA
jgi:co-chaperonin GroES (HSP10)